MYRKILRFLCIVQEVSNVKREKDNNRRLGELPTYAKGDGMGFKGQRSN